jgi:hypothetical protein
MINGDRTEEGIPIFRPDDIITKAEATKILMRISLIQAKQPEDLEYSDITVSWHEGYVRTGQTLGIFNPESDGRIFRPDEGVSREDMVYLIERLILLYD